MSETLIANRHPLKVSEMAENLIGSEIIKLAAEIQEKYETGSAFSTIQLATLIHVFFQFLRN